MAKNILRYEFYFKTIWLANLGAGDIPGARRFLW